MLAELDLPRKEPILRIRNTLRVPASARAEKPTASVEAADALMRLLHFMDAASAGRETMELDLRARRVVQALGLAGERPIAAISESLGVSPSTMTGVVDRLERLGYLERGAHPADRRARVLKLTAKGRRLFEQERRFYRRLIEETLSPLDEAARRQVLRALGGLRNNPLGP